MLEPVTEGTLPVPSPELECQATQLLTLVSVPAVASASLGGMAAGRALRVCWGQARGTQLSMALTLPKGGWH